MSVICLGEILCEGIIEKDIVFKPLDFRRKIYVGVSSVMAFHEFCILDENFEVIILELVRGGTLRSSCRWAEFARFRAQLPTISTQTVRVVIVTHALLQLCPHDFLLLMNSIFTIFGC